MTHPVQWDYDLQDALNVRDILIAACREGRSLGTQRGPLRRACDLLNDVLRNYEASGMEITHEKHYLCLFDALSYFTDALRGQIISRRQLCQARDLLVTLPRIGGEE